MKKTLKLVAFGLLAYLVFLLVTLPAGQVYQYVGAQLPPSVKLYGIGGTVWSGKAELVTLGSQQYRNARWRFQPGALLSGQALFDVDFDNGQSLLKGRIGLDIFGNVVAEELIVQQELIDLQALMQVSPVTLGGKISGRIASLKMRRNGISDANADFTLRDVAFLLPRRTEWGNFKIDIKTDDANTVAKVRDEGGPLLAEGLVTLNDANEYDVTLAVEADDSASADLVRGLEFFGQPGTDGKIRLKYRGSLTQLLGGDSAKANNNDNAV